MNLAFNFKDKLFWIHNFLPEDTYKKMYVNLIKSRKNLDFKKTSITWKTFKEESKDMSESSGQVEHGHEQEHELRDYLNIYHILLKHQQFINLLDLSFQSHIRKYSYGQHLTWHEDYESYEGGERVYAATYYFNKTWGENWGGELMFKSNEGSGFIPIVGNSLVIVKTGLTHKVNPNLKNTHSRFSIQTWIDKKKKIS